MKTVWKYFLDLVGAQRIELPSGGEVLCVHWQKDQICVWVLVDPNAARETRRFWIVGTGHPMSDDFVKYHGTAFDPEGFVWHVFEPM